MKERYGLLTYKTENIGDEIQSVAVNHFLPQIDYFFDRDNINATKITPKDTVKLIMNGWYTHHPENWPPSNPNLIPLLISIHLEQEAYDGQLLKAFLSQKSKDFLKKFGPVGARNIPTAKFLQSHGIDSYFSGCMTLTLQKDKSIPKQKFILAVDVSDSIYASLLKKTQRPIIRLNTNHPENMKQENRFLLAKYWLTLFQSAHLVVTPRLHCMLPCLALETPVIALSHREPERYQGLIELTNHVKEKDFKKYLKDYDIEKPLKNPQDYQKIRKDLIKRCSDFTGFQSKKSFLGDMSYQELLSHPVLIETIAIFVEGSYRGELADQNYTNALKIIQELQEQNSTLQQAQEIGVKGSSKQLISSLKKYIKKKI